MARKLITPEMAKNILENNSHNRKISKSRVAKFKEEILNGYWLYNGESIVVSETGRLLDGQHRLLACVEANTAIEVNLVTDVEDEQNGIDTFLSINTENRSNADALYIAGFKTETANIVKFISFIEAFNRQRLVQKPNGIKLQNHDVVEIAREYGETTMLGFIERAKKLSERCDLLTLNYWIVMVYTIGQEPDGNLFLEKLAECNVLEKGNPISTLLKYFMTLREQGAAGIKYSKARWIAIFKAYKAFNNKEQLERMHISTKVRLDYPANYKFYED
jgi:hypothetical protein